MIRPLGNRIIVGKVAYEQQTLSGIAVVHSHERPRCGRVLAAGPEVYSIKPGDTVYYSRYAGHPVIDAGSVNTCLFEQDVLGYE